MGFLKWLFGSTDPGPDPRSPASVNQNSSGSPSLGMFVEAIKQMPHFVSMQALVKPNHERELLFQFEHYAIREAVFQNHPMLMHDLQVEGPDRFGRCFQRAKEMCHDRAINDPRYLLDPSVMRDQSDVVGNIPVVKRSHGGFTVSILIMPTPQFLPELHFIAIVHKDDEPHRSMDPSPSTRYYTLEMTHSPPYASFCEWTADGKYQYYGLLPTSDLNIFVEAVFTRLFRSG